MDCSSIAFIARELERNRTHFAGAGALMCSTHSQRT